MAGGKEKQESRCARSGGQSEICAMGPTAKTSEVFLFGTIPVDHRV